MRHGGRSLAPVGATLPALAPVVVVVVGMILAGAVARADGVAAHRTLRNALSELEEEGSTPTPTLTPVATPTEPSGPGPNPTSTKVTVAVVMLPQTEIALSPTTPPSPILCEPDATQMPVVSVCCTPTPTVSTEAPSLNVELLESPERNSLSLSLSSELGDSSDSFMDNSSSSSSSLAPSSSVSLSSSSAPSSSVSLPSSSASSSSAPSLSESSSSESSSSSSASPSWFSSSSSFSSSDSNISYVIDYQDVYFESDGLITMETLMAEIASNLSWQHPEEIMEPGSAPPPWLMITFDSQQHAYDAYQLANDGMLEGIYRALYELPVRTTKKPPIVIVVAVVVVLVVLLVIVCVVAFCFCCRGRKHWGEKEQYDDDYVMNCVPNGKGLNDLLLDPFDADYDDDFISELETNFGDDMGTEANGNSDDGIAHYQR